MTTLLSPRVSIHQPGRSVLRFALLLALCSSTAAARLCAAQDAQLFSKPEEAVAALKTAAGAGQDTALRAVLGSAIDPLQNPDPVQATNDLAVFAASLNEVFHFARESTNRIVLDPHPPG